ncbi:MAG: acylphosphatase, partial [Nitrospiraceae bacterium]
LSSLPHPPRPDHRRDFGLPRVARQHGLLGGVRNLDDGRVEVDVEGKRAVIEALLHELKVGPPAAQVTKIEADWSAGTSRFSSFSIWY